MSSPTIDEAREALKRHRPETPYDLSVRLSAHATILKVHAECEADARNRDVLAALADICIELSRWR